MKMLSATCMAIAQAIAGKQIRVVSRTGRFGSYWTIEDQYGMIEVALSEEEAQDRIRAVALILEDRTKQVA